MTQLAIAFDYGSLDKGTRVVVEDARDRIKYLERRTSEGLLEIGRHLIAVKEALPHGKFTPWLDAEFGWSYQSAARFMQVAEAFGQISQIERFQPSALYALASGTVPDEVRDEFIARAESGERVTHRDVKQRLTVVDDDTGEIVGRIEPEEFDAADVPIPSRDQPHALTWMPPPIAAQPDALADVPTAHEYAARDKAARKWITSFYDILVNLNSVRDHGGVAVTTRGWSPARRDELRERIDRLIERLSVMRDELEEISDAA